LSEWIYKFFSALSRVVGSWLLRTVVVIIATWYFVFLPRRIGHSLRFYRALFPGRSWLSVFGLAFRQYQDFAGVYCERQEVDRRSDVRFESVGTQHLAEAKAAGRGAILLMSHVGRWEIGARLLAKRERDLFLLMGGEAPGGSRAGVDQDLRGAGLGVVTVRAGQETDFNILRTSQTLRNGGTVSLAADRSLGPARMLELPFLGHTVRIAAAPFALALSSGAPLLVVFAVKTGPWQYRFSCAPPVVLTSVGRADRQATMERAAAAYLAQLHDLIRTHPEQWHHFGEFLHRNPEAKPPLPT
jgi:lauroyl/myristoyl acyltransferase